jgi:hypothetical protein
MTDAFEWADVVAHLRTRHTVDRTGESAVRIDVARGKGRQSIVVLASETFGLPSATIVAMLGRADAFAHREALEHCASLLHGGLFLRDDVYLFRVSLPLVSLTPRAIDEVVDFVASEATRLRARAFRRPHMVDPRAFATAL